MKDYFVCVVTKFLGVSQVYCVTNFDVCLSPCDKITKGSRVYPVSPSCPQHVPGAAECHQCPPPRPRPPCLLVPDWCLTFSAPAPCPADREYSIMTITMIIDLKVGFMFRKWGECDVDIKMWQYQLDPVHVPGPLSATLRCHKTELSAYNSNGQTWAITPQQWPTAEQKKLDLVSEIHIFMLRSHKG